MTYTVHRCGFLPICLGRATKDCFRGLFCSLCGFADSSCCCSPTCQVRVSRPYRKLCLNRELQILVGTAGPQLRAPDVSGHCRASTANSRSQSGLRQVNWEVKMSVGTAGCLPRAPNLIQHSRTITASSRSQWDLSRECQMSVGTTGRQGLSRELQISVGVAASSMMSVGTAGPQGHCQRRVNWELKMSVAPHP